MTRRRWGLAALGIVLLAWIIGGEWVSIHQHVPENHFIDALGACPSWSPAWNEAAPATAAPHARLTSRFPAGPLTRVAPGFRCSSSRPS